MDEQQQQQQQQEQQQADWKQALPESVREWSEVQQAESPDSFWKRISDQRSFIGNSVQIPSEEAGKEAWDAFNEKLQKRVPDLMRTPDIDDDDAVNNILGRLGKPEDASGYGEVSGDELHFEEGQLEAIQKMAHQAGLTKAQYKKLAAQIGKDAYQMQSQSSNLQQESLETLKKEWGLSAESKYQETVNFAKAAGAPKEIISQLESRSLSAETVFWLNQVAQGAKEGSQINFQPSTSLGGDLTPNEAQEKINDILGNKDHAYHRGESSAKAKMRELIKQANPAKYA